MRDGGELPVFIDDNDPGVPADTIQSAYNNLRGAVLDEIMQDIYNGGDWQSVYEGAQTAVMWSNRLLEAAKAAIPPAGTCSRMETATPPEEPCGQCRSCRASFFRSRHPEIG